eukprot:9679090-Ditylum_brightwellii.AAC.1
MEHLFRDKIDSEGNPIYVDCLKSANTRADLLHFFSSQMNSNAGTGTAHTECDISYTLIGVPQQE